MVQNRTITFEISGFRDGRWLTDSVRDEEQAAMRYARSLLSSGYYEEVKIKRQRSGAGTQVETVILHEKAAADVDKPLTVGGDPDAGPVCETLEMFFSAESRLCIQGLLQSFCDKFQISAIELMHNWTYIRKLNDDHPSLLMAALHKVAIAQAARSGVEMKDRAAVLGRLIDEGSRKAKAIQQQRALPKFEETDPDAAWKQLQQVGGPDAIWLHEQAVCRWLFGFGSQGGKIEKLLACMDIAQDEHVLQLLDSIVAELFSGAKIIDEFFQQHANRAVALGQFADVLTGRVPDDAKIDPLLLQFAKVNKAGKLKFAATVLTNHLTRQVGAGKPLDARGPENDEKLFDQLMVKLRDHNGRLLGDLPMQRAVAGYKLKHRQRTLRRMGMDDAADALAKSYDDTLIQRLIPLVKH
ncbi:hypothetical protein [Roseiterribacter gracilis]|uniref:Uncharacterized protein n=1 Tax=Roseiterribacter gracilis TaxID=2812848 RepID=A0A8S8XC09_9PROT|nr:hypothetical protein TMPK1_14160 [Rhodospirillales bacterium TMPK1]